MIRRSYKLSAASFVFYNGGEAKRRRAVLAGLSRIWSQFASNLGQLKPVELSRSRAPISSVGESGGKFAAMIWTEGEEFQRKQTE